MLTPQEASEHAFQRTSIGGYHIGQVDEFLDVLIADYSTLFGENAVLKSKMKVLVDKIEEYRSTEEAMRKALMAAQRMADEMVREAEQKKDSIIRDAEDSARARISAISREVEAEEHRLNSARENTAAYVEKVRLLHTMGVRYLDALDELQLPKPSERDIIEVEQTADEIDNQVQRLLSRALMEGGAPHARESLTQPPPAEKGGDLSDTAEFTRMNDGPDNETDLSATRKTRIDFGELQFGQDYEIK